MNEVVSAVAAEFGFPSNVNNAELLAERINALIQEDFPKLIFLLYRYDIDETRLRDLLKNSNADTGRIIASMLIARYHEKKISRENSPIDPDIADDEKW